MGGAVARRRVERTAPPLGMAKPLPMQQSTPPPAPPAARAERQRWRGGARRGVGEGILRICCSCDACAQRAVQGGQRDAAYPRCCRTRARGLAIKKNSDAFARRKGTLATASIDLRQFAHLSRLLHTRTRLWRLLPLGVEFDDPPCLALSDAVLADASRSPEHAGLLRPLQGACGGGSHALPPLTHVRSLIEGHVFGRQQWVKEVKEVTPNPGPLRIRVSLTI